MEYILEKKGYNTLRVTSGAYGTIPTTVSYDRILDYIRDMVRSAYNLYGLSFENHTLLIKKVEYAEGYSFFNEEVLLIDSSLELDERFMGPIRSYIAEYQKNATETRARIDLYRNSIIKANKEKKYREHASNEANRLIVSYLENGKADLTELGALARPIHEALTEKSQNPSRCVSIFPRMCEIKSPLLSSKLLRTGCYIACGATAATFLYGLYVYGTTPIPIICSLIPTAAAFGFNFILKKHDAKKIVEAIRNIKKEIEENYSLDEVTIIDEEPAKEQPQEPAPATAKAPQEEQTITQPTTTVVKDAYLRLIESLLTYIKNHPENDYSNESVALNQLSDHYYNAKKAEIKNGPEVAKVPFMQDLAEQEISIYSKNKDFRTSPTEPIIVNSEALKSRLAFLGLSETTISHDYHIKKALSAIDNITNNSYTGCEADIIRIFVLVYTYAERKINESEDLNQAGLDLLKGLRDIEQEINLNHLEADYSVVSSSASIVVDGGKDKGEDSSDKGLRKNYPSQV